MSIYSKAVIDIRLNLYRDIARIANVSDVLYNKKGEDFTMLLKDVQRHYDMFRALEGKKNPLDYGKMKVDVYSTSKKWATKLYKLHPHVKFAAEIDDFNPMKALDYYVTTLYNLIEKDGQARKMTPGIMEHNEYVYASKRKESPVMMIDASGEKEEEKMPYRPYMHLMSRPVYNAMPIDGYYAWLYYMQYEYPDISTIPDIKSSTDKYKMDSARWILHGAWDFAYTHMKDAGVDFLAGETLKLATKIDYAMLDKRVSTLFSSDGGRRFREQRGTKDVKMFLKHWLDDAAGILKDPRFVTYLILDNPLYKPVNYDMFYALWHMFKLSIDTIGPELNNTTTGLNTRMAMKHLDQVNGAQEMRRLAYEHANEAMTSDAPFDNNPTSFGMNLATKWYGQAPSQSMHAIGEMPKETPEGPVDMLDMTMGQLKKHLYKYDEFEAASNEAHRLGHLSKAHALTEREKKMSDEERKSAVERDAYLEQDEETYAAADRYFNLTANEKMAYERYRQYEREEMRHRQYFSSQLNQVNVDMTGLNYKEQNIVNGALDNHFTQQTQKYIEQTSNMSRDDLYNHLDKALHEADATFVPVAPNQTAVVVTAQSQLLTVVPPEATSDATMNYTADPERILTDQEIDYMPAKYRRAARRVRDTSKPPAIAITADSKNIGKVIDSTAKITGLMTNIRRRDESRETKKKYITNQLKAKANIRDKYAADNKYSRKEKLAEYALQMGEPELAYYHLQQPESNNADYRVEPPQTVDVDVFDDYDMTVSVPVFVGYDALTNQRVIAAKEYFASGQHEQYYQQKPVQQYPVQQYPVQQPPYTTTTADGSVTMKDGETYFEYTPEQPVFTSQYMYQTVNQPMKMAAPANTEDSDDEYMSADDELKKMPVPQIPQYPYPPPVQYSTVPQQYKQPPPILKAPIVPTIAPITAPSAYELYKNKALADELSTLFENSYTKPMVWKYVAKAPSPKHTVSKQPVSKPAQLMPPPSPRQPAVLYQYTITMAQIPPQNPSPSPRQPAVLQQYTFTMSQIQPQKTPPPALYQQQFSMVYISNQKPLMKDGGTSPPRYAPHKAPVAYMVAQVDKMEILPPPPAPPKQTMTVHQYTAEVAAQDFEQQVSETIANFDGPETRLNKLQQMREEASNQYKSYMEYKTKEKAKLEDRKEELQQAKMNFDRENKIIVEELKKKAQKEKDEFKFWQKATESSKKFEREVAKVYLEELKLVNAQETEERKLEREIKQYEARENMFRAKIELEQKKLEAAYYKLYDRQQYHEKRKNDLSLYRAQYATENTRQRLLSKTRDLEAKFGFGRSAMYKKLEEIKENLHGHSAASMMKKYGPRESSPPPNAPINQGPPVMPRIHVSPQPAYEESSLADSTVYAPPINTQPVPPPVQTTTMKPTTYYSSSIYNVPTQANPTLLQQAPVVYQSAPSQQYYTTTTTPPPSKPTPQAPVVYQSAPSQQKYTTTTTPPPSKPTPTPTTTTAYPTRGGRTMHRTGGGGGDGGDDGDNGSSGSGRRPPDRGAGDDRRTGHHRGRSPPKNNSEYRRKLNEDRARDASLNDAYTLMKDYTLYHESLRYNVKTMKNVIKDLANKDSEIKKLREKYMELDHLKQQYDINHASAMAELATRPDLDQTIKDMIAQPSADHATLVNELKRFHTAKQLEFDLTKRYMNETIHTIEYQFAAANYHSVYTQDKIQELNNLVVKYGAERANIGMPVHNWPQNPTTQDLIDGLMQGSQEMRAFMDAKKQKMQDLTQVTHRVEASALDRQSLDQEFELLKNKLSSNPSLATDQAFYNSLYTYNNPDALATNLKAYEIYAFYQDLYKKQAVKNALNHAKNVDHFITERTRLNEYIIADMKKTRDDLFKTVPNSEAAYRTAMPYLFRIAEMNAGSFIYPTDITAVEQQIDTYMRAQKIMYDGLKPKIAAVKKIANMMESIAEVAASNELDMTGIKRRINKDIDDILTYFPNVPIQTIADGVFDNPGQVYQLYDHVVMLKQYVLTHVRGGKLARENLLNTVNEVSVYSGKLKHLYQEEQALLHQGKMRLQDLQYAGKTDIVGITSLAGIQAEEAKIYTEITSVQQNVIAGRLALSNTMTLIQTLKDEIKERKGYYLSTAALYREVDKLTIEQNAIRAEVYERQRKINEQRTYYDTITVPIINQRSAIAAAGHDLRRRQLLGIINDPSAFDQYLATQLANTSDAGAVEVMRGFTSDDVKNVQGKMYRNMLICEEYYKPSYMAQSSLHKMADLFLRLGNTITKERYLTMHKIAYLDDVTIYSYSPNEQERAVKERRDDVLKMGYLNYMMSHSNILFEEYRVLTQMATSAQIGGGAMDRNLKTALDGTGHEGVGRAVKAMMDDMEGNIVKMDRTTVGDINNDKLAKISNFLYNGMQEHMRKINSKIREMSGDMIKNDSFSLLHNAFTYAGRGLALHFARAIRNNDNDMYLNGIYDMDEIRGMASIASSLRDVVMHMGFQLYQGIDPAVNAAAFSRELGANLNRLYASRANLSPQAVNDLATETVVALVSGMRAELVHGLVGKLQGSLAYAVQFLDADMLTKFVGNEKDETRSQILWEAGFIPPKTMENFRGWRESLINRMPYLVSLHERVTADYANVLTLPQPGYQRQVLPRDRDYIREEIKYLAYNKYGDYDTPMRGFAVLGSHMGQAGRSMYDHPIAMASFQANREMIRKRDPAQLYQTKNEMYYQRAALNDETGRVTGVPANAMQMLTDMLPNFQKVLIRDVLTANNLGNTRYITRNVNQWDFHDRLCFDLDLLGNLNEAFVRIKTGIEHDKYNLIPISYFRVTYLRALENLAHESINRVVMAHGRRNGPITQLPMPYQNRAQTIAATAYYFTNDIRAKLQTEINDSYNYNREYMEDYHVLMDLLEYEIVQQEARNSHWGKVNKVMDNTLNELQNRYMRNLQQFGLMDIQDPMIRYQQQQNILNTQQAMRHASQVSPYSYIHYNRGLMSKSMANGGLAGNATIGDLRQARYMKGDNKEAQKASNDGYEGNRKNDREKANETLRDSMQISRKDAKLLRNLRKKKNGKLGFHDPKTGEKRELTDKEKLEVSRLLYAVAVAGLTQTMKNASQAQIEREKKRLKTMADDKSKQAQLLEKIKDMVE